MIHQDEKNKSTSLVCDHLLSVTSLIDLAHAADCAFLDHNITPKSTSHNASSRKRKCSSMETINMSHEHSKARKTVSKCSKSFISLARAATADDDVRDKRSCKFVGEVSTADSVESSFVENSSRSCRLQRTNCRPQNSSPCNIPSTISASSCESNNTGTSRLFYGSRDPLFPPDDSTSGSSVSSRLVELKQSYGWFVETDCVNDDYNGKRGSVISNIHKVSSDDLAFSAPVAPNGKRYKFTEEDPELAYAVAADTVDDVLGDFF